MAEEKIIAAEAEEMTTAEAAQEGAEAPKEEQPSERTVVTLENPYVFEGKEYSEIDLTGLNKLTIQDAIDAQRQLFGEQEVAAAVLCETTTAFARTMAAKATGLPIEFFKLMPRGLTKRVSAAVRGHLNVDSDTKNHVMHLAQPRHFKGKVYQDIDLNGIGDLNSLNESEAENRLAREGFVVTENSTNFLYACVIAAMATGIPEEFFTGLPLYEVLKLKNAVNDPDFFG